MLTQPERERREFFDRIATEWDANVPDFSQSRFYQTWENVLQPVERTLEIGCGTGRLLRCLGTSSQVQGKVCAIDYSRLMLDVAATKRQPGQLLIQADALAMPFGAQSFMRVLIINTFPHLTPYRGLLAEVHRVLGRHGEIHIVHFAGREHINAVHAQLDAVRCDLLLPLPELVGLAQETGYAIVTSSEADDHYWLWGRKHEDLGQS